MAEGSRALSPSVIWDGVKLFALNTVCRFFAYSLNRQESGNWIKEGNMIWSPPPPALCTSIFILENSFPKLGWERGGGREEGDGSLSGTSDVAALLSGSLTGQFHEIFYHFLGSKTLPGLHVNIHKIVRETFVCAMIFLKNMFQCRSWLHRYHDGVVVDYADIMKAKLMTT